MTGPHAKHPAVGARLTLGVAVPAVIVAVALLPLVAWGGDVPDPVASHFDPSGRADASMPLAVFAAVTGLGAAVGAGVCIVLAIGGARWPRLNVAFAGGLAAFVSGLMALKTFSLRAPFISSFAR